MPREPRVDLRPRDPYPPPPPPEEPYRAFGKEFTHTFATIMRVPDIQREACRAVALELKFCLSCGANPSHYSGRCKLRR